VGWDDKSKLKLQHDTFFGSGVGKATFASLLEPPYLATQGAEISNFLSLPKLEYRIIPTEAKPQNLRPGEVEKLRDKMLLEVTSLTLLTKRGAALVHGGDGEKSRGDGEGAGTNSSI